MIDKEKNVAFWDRAASRSRATDRAAFAGMLMEGREFEAMYRCIAEQERMLTIFTPTKSSRVLEIGSGGGRWAAFFSTRVKQYIGLDISPQMIAIAEAERIRSGLLNVEYECQDFLDYESSAPFDLIFFSGVLQYMDDSAVAACISKANRLLAPSGVVISRDSIQVHSRVEKIGEYPVIYRTEEEYIKIFESAGFKQTYSNLSYLHKRFTQIASKLYGLPGVNYRMAYGFRELLCFLDASLGEPRFLKTKRYFDEVRNENPQQHKLFRYVRREMS